MSGFFKFKVADAWFRLSSEFVYSTSKRYKPIYIRLMLYLGYDFCLTLYKSDFYRFCGNFKIKFTFSVVIEKHKHEHCN